MEKNNICTILVCSCDTYEDTWMPFFKLLKKYWPNCNFPIVLNTETKQFKYEGLDIKTYSLYKNSKAAWGKRLIETLKLIDSKYVLFILDDFFLEDYVEDKKVSKCIEWMEKDNNIAVFSFMPTPGQNIDNDKYEGFELRPKDGEYRFNCQAAIWRRERLIEFVRSHESPWDWELLGSIRSQRYNDEFYSLKETAPKVFNYDLEHGGAVHRGKWVKEVVLPICEKNDIKIDFSKRGFEEHSPFDYIPPKKKKNIFKRIINRLKYEFNTRMTKYKSLR